MLRIYDKFTGDPIITSGDNIPKPGLYYSIIIDAYTSIICPFHRDEDTCFVVQYKLVNIETLEESIFKETYCPFGSNPRGDKFFSYIHKHFSVPYGEDEALIGLREKLEISWDVLGGYAYPVVARRWFIDLPQAYKWNYLNEQEEEAMED